MIEAGFVSPARTTVVCSTHRLYTIHEKTATGRGIYPRERLAALARATARRLVAFDALSLARERGTEVNAVLLGALAGSGALPVGVQAFRKAIESRGVQVAANLKGFDLGLDTAKNAEGDAHSANEGVSIESLQPRTAGREFSSNLDGLPDSIRAVIELTDYLKPDLDEIWGILPHRLVAPFARWAERRWPHGRPTLGQHVRTTTVSGYLRVWLLARLRVLRPVSWRAHVEHVRIDRWLEGVTAALARDEALACEVAQLARLVKGYGDVRRRLTALFDTGLALALRVAETEGRSGAGFAVSTALIERFRTLVL